MKSDEHVFHVLDNIDRSVSGLLGLGDLLHQAGQPRVASAIQVLALQIDESAGELRMSEHGQLNNPDFSPYS